MTPSNLFTCSREGRRCARCFYIHFLIFSFMTTLTLVWLLQEAHCIHKNRDSGSLEDFPSSPPLLPKPLAPSSSCPFVKGLTLGRLRRSAPVSQLSHLVMLGFCLSRGFPKRMIGISKLGLWRERREKERVPSRTPKNDSTYFTHTESWFYLYSGV